MSVEDFDDIGALSPLRQEQDSFFLPVSRELAFYGMLLLMILDTSSYGIHHSSILPNTSPVKGNKISLEPSMPIDSKWENPRIDVLNNTHAPIISLPIEDLYRVTHQVFGEYATNWLIHLDQTIGKKSGNLLRAIIIIAMHEKRCKFDEDINIDYYGNGAMSFFQLTVPNQGSSDTTKQACEERFHRCLRVGYRWLQSIQKKEQHTPVLPTMENLSLQTKEVIAFLGYVLVERPNGIDLLQRLATPIFSVETFALMISREVQGVPRESAPGQDYYRMIAGEAGVNTACLQQKNE